MFRRSWKKLQFATVCAVVLGSGSMVEAQSVGSWVMKAPVPAALSEVGVAYADSKVQVIGGSVLGYTGPYHEEYDPTTDKWRARAPLPRSLDHIGTTVLNGKVYAFGGFVGGSVHSDPTPGHRTSLPSLTSWSRKLRYPSGKPSATIKLRHDRIFSWLRRARPDSGPAIPYKFGRCRAASTPEDHSHCAP
jgi:hypothetical protein